MGLVKWDPGGREAAPFRSLREEVDRVFEGFFRGWPRPWSGGPPSGVGQGFIPSVDLKETDTELILTAELPGVTRDQFEISVTEGSVTIRGERRAVKESQQDSYHYRESSRGTFQRVVALPRLVVPEKVKAKLKDGVLTVTAPKAEPSRSREVRVRVE